MYLVHLKRTIRTQNPRLTETTQNNARAHQNSLSNQVAGQQHERPQTQASRPEPLSQAQPLADFNPSTQNSSALPTQGYNKVQNTTSNTGNFLDLNNYTQRLEWELKQLRLIPHASPYGQSSMVSHQWTSPHLAMPPPAWSPPFSNIPLSRIGPPTPFSIWS